MQSPIPDELAQDQEYVEQIRTNVAYFERWRRWWIAFYALLLLGTLAVSFYALQLVNALVQGPPGMPGALPGFEVGLVVGATVGLLAVKAAAMLVHYAMTSTRNERLMLRYYDALRERE